MRSRASTGEARAELNPHGFAPRVLPELRVYQFHHAGTLDSVQRPLAYQTRASTNSTEAAVAW